MSHQPGAGPPELLAGQLHPRSLAALTVIEDGHGPRDPCPLGIVGWVVVGPVVSELSHCPSQPPAGFPAGSPGFRRGDPIGVPPPQLPSRRRRLAFRASPPPPRAAMASTTRPPSAAPVRGRLPEVPATAAGGRDSWSPSTWAAGLEPAAAGAAAVVAAAGAAVAVAARITVSPSTLEADGAAVAVALLTAGALVAAVEVLGDVELEADGATACD